LAVVRRTLKRQSPFMPDAHHLHHVLLRTGHSHRWAVGVLYMWTAILSFGTVSLVFVSVEVAIILIGSGVVVASLITASPAIQRTRFRGRTTAGAKANPLLRLTGAEHATHEGDPAGGSALSGKAHTEKPGRKIAMYAAVPCAAPRLH